jgi:hypothetical protein
VVCITAVPDFDDAKRLVWPERDGVARRPVRYRRVQRWRVEGGDGDAAPDARGGVKGRFGKTASVKASASDADSL